MNLNNQTTVNVQEKSNLIWAIADLIRDFYKPQYILIESAQRAPVALIYNF